MCSSMACRCVLCALLSGNTPGMSVTVEARALIAPNWAVQGRGVVGVGTPCWAHCAWHSRVY